MARICYLVLAHLIPCAMADTAEARRPNMLIAVADDWGFHAGAYGTRWVKTPAFDRVAREGLLFNRAYTPMAKCAPSRAILLTGRHLWQLEEAGNHLAAIQPKYKSWPESLMDHGWHVGFTGKGWGPGTAHDPSGKPRNMTGFPFQQRRLKPSSSGISDIDYTANFNDFLNAAAADQPWCFWYGALEPHRRYEFQSGTKKGGKNPADIDRVPGYWPDHETVRHDMLDYAYEVEHADTHLGRMLAELERRRLLDNTIVIVTGDHGMPFPRIKGHTCHDANHVPLAILWPGGMPHTGRKIDDFVDFTDVAATVLDYAGISWKDSGMMPVTGRSWRPIIESQLSGRVVKERDHALLGKERTDVGRPHNQGYPTRGVVTDHWFYLRNYEPSRWPSGNPETGYADTDASPTKSLILDLGRKDSTDPHWLLNFGMRAAEELYDLREDPDCIRNLATSPQHTAIAASLRERMETALKEQGDPRMAGRGAVFDEYKPVKGDGFYEKHQRGEKVEAGWLAPSDFEAEPVSPR